MLFMCAKNCLDDSTDECSGNKNYVTMYKNFAGVTDKQIKISNKINSYNCPTSWYKNGELEMVNLPLPPSTPRVEPVRSKRCFGFGCGGKRTKKNKKKVFKKLKVFKKYV